MRNVLQQPLKAVAIGTVLAVGLTVSVAAEERKVTYLCDKGATIEVAFDDERAVLVHAGQTVVMTALPTGSGYLYTGGGAVLRGKEHEATWIDAQGEVRQCRDEVHAMSQPQVEPPMLTIEGTKWRLVHFQSSDDAIGTVVPPRLENYLAEFNTNGELAMQLDCNRLRASWTSDRLAPEGASLSISAGAMTRAYCGDDALDGQIARDLERVRSFVIRDGKLSLVLEADSGIYLWEPAAP
ncbi:META domain-containing protein [Tabrizicola flagellatus]|uniref:META domain-containing protein n=1 Tax=Tabrizicola flagellatus TaxID=2593021 RepID=UPI0011F30EEC|nr:META domain-containing protein [Tabrizicola flagellatus]